MLLLQARDMTISFGDRHIIDAPFSIDIFDGDRIGIVGQNGMGKTTLLRLLSGELTPDQGSLSLFCDAVFFRQMEEAIPTPTEHHFSSFYWEFCTFDFQNPEILSGGQRTRLKLADLFAKEGALYFFDEPTTNLDRSGKALLLEKLQALPTYILVCHDREVLEICCDKILEIDKGSVYRYSGSYSNYLEEKERFSLKHKKEYETYVEERKRLTSIYREQLRHAAKISKKPRDKGKQTAGRRAGGRSEDGQQKAVQRSAMATVKRLERLEVIEKPQESDVVTLDFRRNDPPANKIVIRIEDLTFGYGDNRLFEKASLYVENGKHLALLGDNGAGKSTLFRLIVQGNPSITVAPKARLGYFSQTLDGITFRKTVYENAMETNTQKVSLARTILNRMLFSADDLPKSAHVLSGGELVRLALAKLVLSDANVLILDELTNYLDIPSIEAIESLLSHYPGTILFASHDRHFVEAVATDIVEIQNRTFV